MLSVDFRRIAIVGRGLIGSSIELAAGSGSGSTRLVALDRGDDLAAVAGADLVVLSAPILENLRLLPVVHDHVSPDTLITDTGSTKRAIVDAAAGLRFIGGHPVAGAAGGGREAARADLFTGRPWILTPTADTSVEDLARLKRFVEDLGASVQVLEAEEHDRIFALVSHLPQLVVSALMDVVGSRAGERGLALAGAGLRDSTRLAASPPDIWLDIVQTNHADVERALDAVIATLTALREDAGGEKLRATFESAARWKRALDSRPI